MLRPFVDPLYIATRFASLAQTALYISYAPLHCRQKVSYAIASGWFLLLPVADYR